jgi:hypothetical protein
VTQADDTNTTARWRWRTFPVYFAFATGMLIAALANRETDSGLELVVMVAAVFLFGYAIAHLIVTNILVSGRIRRRQLEPRDSDEYEDVIVHPK